jgi:hypothetical protein
MQRVNSRLLVSMVTRNCVMTVIKIHVYDTSLYYVEGCIFCRTLYGIVTFTEVGVGNDLQLYTGSSSVN